MENAHKKSLSTDITPSLSLSNLEFIQKLGQSPFGEVWKVKLQDQDKPLTLKKISKSKIQKIQTQFIREISKWSKIQHKNLIQIISYFEDDDFIYLLMEQIEGIPLSKKLLIEKCLERSAAIDVLIQIIDTIEYLHSLHPPVMYKYIKPDNIFIDLNGNIKLTDFCWASVAGDEDSGGVISSTLEYLAPEMFGKSDFGISIDIWCIGVLIYELNIGKSPFKKNSTVGILSDIQKCNIFYPEDMDVTLKDLLGKVLIKDPEMRFSLNEIKKHKWFAKKTIEVKDYIGVTAEYLRRQIEKRQEENEVLNRKIRAADTEIEIFMDSCGKLEERIVAVQQILDLLTDENEKTVENLNLLEVSEEENSESSEGELSAVKVRTEIVKRELEILKSQQENLMEMKEFRQRGLSCIETKQKNLANFLKLLNERYKCILSPSLMMAKALVYTVPEAEAELFNILSGSVNSNFSKSCENLLTKVQDISNFTYLKERYICELSILYQKKQAELLKGYEEERTGFKLKAKKNKVESCRILKSYAEEIMEREMSKLDMGYSEVDEKELEAQRERFKELKRKHGEAKRKVQMMKREILKLRIQRYRKGLDMKSKLCTLSNLTDAMLQAKVDLEAYKVRKVC